MHIFHLVPNMNFGGLQEIVRELSLSQRRAGHTVTIGCWTNASNNAATESQLQDAGVEIVYLRRGSKGQQVGGKKYLFLKLKQHLGPGQADILHIHNPFMHYLYGALAARAAGSTRIVETLHATVWMDHKRKWKATFWIGAMLSHVVVSVCDEVESVVRARFVLPRKKLAVIENGIDLTRFLAVPPRVPRREIVIGTIGRMSGEKNQRVLIEAFAQLQPRFSNIRLRLLGGGHLEPQLKELTANLGIDDVVEFCGFSADTPAFLSTLDLFVLPSDSEAMPLTLLEAIASGLPVVATAVGGVPRIVATTEAGWLCAPHDRGSLAKALEAAITCEHLAEMGERARPKVSQSYSAERMSADYEQLYLRLLNKESASKRES
ncbi:MAG: glycosyltransferase [Acidobacteriaceae bacterium]